jgi:uncharacterized membrane protein HdeD (DUF308 family)
MSAAEPHPKVTDNGGQRSRHRVRGLLVVFMGGLALAVPFVSGQLAIFLVGVLLICCGVLEMVETFRAPSESSRASVYFSGMVSVLVGILLLSSPHLALRGLAVFFGGSFLLDGANKIVASLKNRTGAGWKGTLILGMANAALGLMLVTGWPLAGQAIVLITVGLRMVAAGWAMLLGRRQETVVEPTPLGLHPDRGLRLPAHPEFIKLEESLEKEDAGRRPIDAYWCWIFILLFFAIHVGRMRVDWNLVGMISPLVAVVGDIATALLVAFGLILPSRMAWRKMSRPLERRCWESVLGRLDKQLKPSLTGRLYYGWLKKRLRFARRLARMRWSPTSAFRWGLQVGLPVTAILIAVNPMWGFSWFFNSESWASGVWDHWAAARTDIWRESMIQAIQDRYQDVPAERLFRVEPEGVADVPDFSFLVLGDTGEGGAAQHSLRDQYLFLAKRPDVKFLVISSDVIYPSGAMVDYEPKFYLPFKGFTKPIYAIPGNHDWYDALEGFAANFLQPDAARACMMARIETDGRLTTTTEKRIDRYVQEAARLRQEYGVRTGWQRGPFFEVQTEHFALIVVDTGVLRSVDSKQWDWLTSALDRSRGKCVMVILGHPLYAGGRYQGGDEAAGEWAGPKDVEPFIAIHRLLRDHHVEVVMAGDTHYFEHYVEKYVGAGESRTMLHFVNGGGGAYTSIGTPLDWPAKPALPDCAFFPRTDVVVSKLDRTMPGWKMPLWLWARDLRAWPFTAETVAGAFDYGRAPFFQSFVEVRVEGSAGHVRLIPHGANGPLRWRDLQTFGGIMPAGKTDLDLVEFVVPLRARRP